MSDELITVATFEELARATLAKNRLEDAGIRAVLADQEMMAMAPLYAVAIGQIKLQVLARDASKAQQALMSRGPQESSPAATVDSDPVLTQREKNADRAFRGAVLGLFLLPLQLYVSWLLANLFLDRGEWSQQKRRQASLALLINLAGLIELSYVAIMMLRQF